jgi:hypothetical protein
MGTCSSSGDAILISASSWAPGRAFRGVMVKRPSDCGRSAGVGHRGLRVSGGLQEVVPHGISLDWAGGIILRVLTGTKRICRLFRARGREMVRGVRQGETEKGGDFDAEGHGGD